MTRARTNADQAHTESVESIPHIIPGVLYPAVAGKLLDGSTSHSGNYGTAQSDGYSYYYTDIKGSKPIKDPRIGGHFGSQRHMFTSIQLLEQETATHGKNVYSVDGREWIRVVDGTGTWLAQNNAEGAWIYQNGSDCTGMVIEITGYFNDINTLNYTYSNNPNDIDIKVNGTMSHEGHTTCAGNASVETPLGARYVRSASLSNFGSTVSTSLGTSPAINTIHIECTNGSSEYWRNFGIELIAQDTSSTANKSKIQIPSQNVVSYGKKFTVSGTPHYDPFNGFTSGTDISSYIDEATSLGMSNWKVSSTWYRPFNGGRVVKWVDSSGNIKTSVTMIPPNAQNIGGTASNAIDLSSSQTNDDTINFNTSAIDHSLSEVAKTFHWREFGNGNANGGAAGTYKDFSMLDTSARDCAYVMDDGLTGFSAEDTLIDGTANADFLIQNTKAGYITFIGTGISFSDVGTAEAGIPDGTYSINLPYGTHIFKYLREDTNQDEIYLDGIKIKDPAGTTGGYFGSKDITFQQPKKPPIPEEAVVLCDFMLMADFVPQTSAGMEKISKGVRKVQASRDVFYDETDGDSFTLQHSIVPEGFELYLSGNADSDTSMTMRIPAFGTNYVHRGYQSDTRVKLYIDTTDNDSSATKDNTASYGSYAHLTSDLALGVYKFGANGVSGTNGHTTSFEIASPIHTSSHYQPFETPYLHELVGGDRNMEQHNLVVTPDGKTWDEVTRDTSYIGDTCVQTTTDSETTWATAAKFDEWRGMSYTYNPLMNKDFAIAYDRIICLVDGEYTITVTTRASGTGEHASINVSGQEIINANLPTDNQNFTLSTSLPLKRGDYVMFKGSFGTSLAYNRFIITRL